MSQRGIGFGCVAGKVGWWAMMAVLLAAFPALAGGGGENMLLVVDPNNEQALRVANAYAQIRNIPDSHIVFTESRQPFGRTSVLDAESAGYVNRHLTPVQDYLTSSGLRGQIDYIGTLGQPTAVAGQSVFRSRLSSSYAYARLDALSPYDPGIEASSVRDIASTTSPLATPNMHRNYQLNTNDAIHYTTHGDWYMSGAVAYTGLFGNSPDQVIGLLARTAAADGTKPQGTVYYENNGDIRSRTRGSQWYDVAGMLEDRNIPTQLNNDTPGSTPLNKDDVRGAIIGRGVHTLPNGSTYLPGSWADNLTSVGAAFNSSFQTKMTELIAAGVGATSGTVAEPGANAALFPNGTIYAYAADGSTLNEAFAKSVLVPGLALFLGDLLAQPYADVPDVQLTNGPADHATVSDTLQLQASASLNNPTLATGIAQMELYIDGKLAQTVAGAGASFEVDTTTLSDGYHELRVVAVNNAAAESQNHLLRRVVVDNDGRSSAVVGGSRTVDPDEIVPIAVQSSSGSSSVVRVELRHLGRALGQVAGSTGSADLDASQLAYGDNLVVPVAVYSDGQEVAGQPITVTRERPWMAGAAPTAQHARVAGVKAEYFIGQGGDSIANSDFTVSPDVAENLGLLHLRAQQDSRFLDRPFPDPSEMPVSDLDHLAVRFSGRFEVSASEVGEYTFFMHQAGGSRLLRIDGQDVVVIDNWNNYFSTYDGDSVFLQEGEHTLELLAAHYVDGESVDPYFDINLFVRGPQDPVTRLVGDDWLYQAVPEPGSIFLVLGCAAAALGRRRSPSRRAVVRR